MTVVRADAVAIEHGAYLLRQGGLVAFPTETVYGLGADASSSEAVHRIFKAKGRPADHPLIVHIASADQLSDWALRIPDAARLLAAHFWPGPLAMILQKRPDVPMAVTGGQPTVGLRVPKHPVALRLLQQFGGGIAAPSANRFCRVSPTRAAHVEEELGDAVDLILDGGPCDIGVESTIVDLSGGPVRMLRPGRITRAQIEALLQIEVAPPLGAHANDVRAPGMLEVHYAPTTHTLLVGYDRLNDMVEELLAQQKRIGLLSWRGTVSVDGRYHRVNMPKQAQAYAQKLYAALRDLDAMRLERILVEAPPEGDGWDAVNDRLRKASATIVR